MASADLTVPDCPAGRSALDPESTTWVQGLNATGPAHDETVARLYELLLWVARGEVRRRRGQLRIAGPELDDQAHQAAADALLGVTGKVAQFRGESRFTTWACKFAIFEVSTKIGRHFWQKPTAPMDAEDWDRLLDRFGLDPARVAEWRDVLAALDRAVDDEHPGEERADLHRALRPRQSLGEGGRHSHRTVARCAGGPAAAGIGPHLPGVFACLVAALLTRISTGPSSLPARAAAPVTRATRRARRDGL